MPVLTTDSMRAFVNGARLSKVPTRSRLRGEEAPPIELKDTDAQALVVGSGLIVAAENVPAETRQDIVNCTLFAQLAASGAVTDPAKVNEWYGEYFRALSICGWAQSSTQFEEFKASGKHLETHKSIIKVLTVMLGPAAPAVTLVTEMLNALQSMDENSPWITLFNRESTTTRTSRFQVATAQKNDDGLVEVALVAFDLRSKTNLTQVLFFKFSSNKVSLKFSQGKATIYEAALAQTRQLVKDRLEAYRSEYIREVKFPPKTGTVRSTALVRPRRRAA
jgi:hypothetical protein|nr:hypothetical protein [uncultured Steroidobacter sp.]